MHKIKWVNDNPGAAPDERGYWTSLEGRFHISPNYRHTTYPDSYKVVDSLRAIRKQLGFKYKNVTETSFDTVRDCKQWANDIINKEFANY